MGFLWAGRAGEAGPCFRRRSGRRERSFEVKSKDETHPVLADRPSFQDFDGGAGSRDYPTREVTSFWYPTWLCYSAGLIPESRVVDAPPENFTVSQVADLAPDFPVGRALY